MVHLASSLLWALCLSGATASGRRTAPFTVQQLRKMAEPDDSVDPESLYPAYTLSVPIDHFHNDSRYEPHTNATFELRYWFDAQYYEEGGPVIVLASGETSGTDRLVFLQKGIAHQLALATHGIGVILEHRYYGTSFPVDNLTTESMRFLSTEQAIADTAYFAQHVKFPGLEDKDLTSATTPYIAYGGSYAGAYVAILRKVYPDIFWGAISSSGVTEAIYDYWKYYEAAAIYGPPACIKAQKILTDIVDNIVIKKANANLVQPLKNVFGLGNVTYTDDFVNALIGGIDALQSYVWDPAESDPSFFTFCEKLSSEKVVYPDTEPLRSEVTKLVAAGGYAASGEVVVNQMLNYIGYVNSTQVADCDATGETQDQCFTNRNATLYAQDDISQTWRSWPYQYCTEWGYLQTGSGVPKDELPLVSRAISLEYTTIVCRDAFNITTPPDVNIINKYGGFGFSYPRLAIIDGEWDPWRQATPHAIGLPDRKSTTSEPFILIAKAVHHWDEYGLFPNETTPELPPPAVAEAQNMTSYFVKEWLAEWAKSRSSDGTGQPEWPLEL